MNISDIANSALNRLKKIYIRGFCQSGFLLSAYFYTKKIGFEGYFDSDDQKVGKSDIFGKKCFSNNDADSDHFVFCAIQNENAVNEIEKELSDKNIEFVSLSYQEIIENCICIDDETFLKYCFRQIMGYELDLDAPKTFNEKIQWLKLYDRRPEYTIMADKYSVKKYVADKIGEQYIIPTLGVWDHFDDIDFDSLPEQFVLKCTHDSGSIIVCKDKLIFDFKSAKQSLEKALKNNYFYWGREWAYKNIKPRIIAEKYIDSLGKSDSVEYKITCFNGKAQIITVCQGIAHSSFDVRSNDNYDRELNHLPWYAYYKNAEQRPKLPKQIYEMIRLSDVISTGFPQVRVDFYLVDGRIYFGECTFYTWAGFINFTPPEWDKKLGDILILPSEV